MHLAEPDAETHTCPPRSACTDGAHEMRFSTVAEGVDLLVTSDAEYSTNNNCGENGFLPNAKDSWRSYGRLFGIRVRRARTDGPNPNPDEYVATFNFSLVRVRLEPARTPHFLSRCRTMPTMSLTAGCERHDHAGAARLVWLLDPRHRPDTVLYAW